MIDVIGLSKAYRGKGCVVNAVDKISCTFERGKTYCVVGPNGAGKTTFFKLLGGVTEPTSGEIKVDGTNIAEMEKEWKKNVGLVSDEGTPYEFLTAEEYVHFFGNLYGLDDVKLPQARERVIHRLGLEEFRDRRCGELSLGTARKLAFCRALMHSPKVLILDEPFEHLDVVVRREVRRFVFESRPEDGLLIYSTHVPEEVEAFSDEIVVLVQGRVVFMGPSSKLKERFEGVGIEEAIYELFESERRS